MDIEKGQLLLSPERPNDSVYIVLSGQLQVHLGSLDSPKIADLVPGTCAGEMSLVEDKDPNAYVIATEDSHLMVVSHDLLWKMVDRSRRLAKNLLVVISERVRSDNEFIAERLGVLRRAERNAVTDALTGLGNRHWMQEMFERELKRARTGESDLCLMMADVDRFKEINDTSGHIIGDRILATIASALRERLRPTDLIVRFGGDEFAILLPAEATATADRVRENLMDCSDPSLPKGVTVSIGLTAATSSDDLDRLLERADGAMYDAKEQGRIRVTVRDPEHRGGPLPAKPD
jgi:diguanylate cyclase (GGDEF)-like protein